MIQVKTRTIVICVVLALFGLFALGWILGTAKQKKVAKIALSDARFEITRLQVELHGKTVYLSRVQQELATQKELIRRGEIEKAELKALNIKKVHEINRLNLQIDTLLQGVMHNGKVIRILNDKVDSLLVSTNKPYNALLLPLSFNKTDEWLTLNGTFDDCGKLDIGLNMKLGVDVVSGIDKTTKRPMVNVMTTNPYIKPISINSYKADTPRKKRFGLGLQGGYGFTFSGTTKACPYVGAGLSYDFIQF